MVQSLFGSADPSDIQLRKSAAGSRGILQLEAQMGSRKKDGTSKYGHGTFLQRRMLETPAWRALSPKAQMLHIWLRLEWKGPKYNNNGKIRLSCRQAAARIGIGVNTAMGAFHELQAKGFITITKLGALGVEGEARGPTYELTDVALPFADPRMLFLHWKEGEDFEVVRHAGVAER